MVETIKLSYEYVETLEDFCNAIYKKSASYSHDTEQILLVVQAIHQGLKIEKIEKNLGEVANDLGIDINEFNYILRKLKKLGILQDKRGVLRFSKLFMLRITKILQFYSNLTGMLTPCQKMLKEKERYIEYLQTQIKEEDKGEL